MNVPPVNNKCRRCASDLDARSIEGYCPRCLALAAFQPVAAEEPVATEAGVRGPACLGAYELLEEIGRGGMGVVYRARQEGLNREVAVKVLRAGPFAAEADISRFRREAAAAAGLRHPNIVAVHEVGEAGGHAYFSMDLVRGRTLAELTREEPLEPRRAARYAWAIAAAAAAAHAQGILHRDLKPANVIIDADDQPRVTDFGLAKRLDAGEATATQQVAGSPGYMPPEQADPQRGKLSAASDVYALGALLYHLVTGRPPFSSASIPATLTQVLHAEPAAPRRLNPAIPPDLETICLKCLRKDPERRYPSALELADELKRFLDGEPIRARPISVPEKLWRWALRKPVLAALVLLVHLVGAAGLLGILWQWRRAERSAAAEHRERDIAQAANRDLQRANARLAETVGLLEVDRAEDFFRAGDAARGLAHLAAMLRSNPSNQIAANRMVSALAHRKWALPSAAPLRRSGPVLMVSFSPEGGRVLSVSGEKTAEIWDAATGRTLAAMSHDAPLLSARFSPDGRAVVTACAGGAARVWTAIDGAPRTPPLSHGGGVTWAEFHPDGRSVLTASADGNARIWDAASGALGREFQHDASPVLIARFSPDGEFMAAGTEAGGLVVRRLDSGGVVFQADAHAGRITGLAFSPDGRRILSSGADGRARLWDAMSGGSLGDPLVHRRPVWHCEFSPDGELMLTACEDGAARVWDVRTLRPVCEPLRHDSGVIFGRFSPDSQRVVTTSSDNTARVWDARAGVPLCQPLWHVERVLHAEFDGGGRRIVTGSFDGTAQVWALNDPAEPGRRIHHDLDVTPFAFSSDGRAVLSGAQDRSARLWNAQTGKALCGPISHEGEVWSADMTPDGRRIATASGDGSIRVWVRDEGMAGTDPSMASPRLVAGPFGHQKRVLMLRFSPDGSLLASASADGTARIWVAASGLPAAEPLRHGGGVLAVQFSRDGQRVATASEDRTARVWDVRSGRPVTAPLAHLDHVHWAEFSSDGAKVLTASTDNTACVWDVRSSRRAAPPLQHPRMVGRAVFSPDGRRAATASIDRTARIWDAVTGQALVSPLSHDSFVEQVFFTSDGERLVTICRSGLARVWDSASGRPLTEWLNAGSHHGACFDPVGETIALGAREGAIHLWDIWRAPPPPARFLDLAEAAAGMRVDERGNAEIVPRQDMGRIAADVAAGESGGFYGQFAKRFLARRASDQARSL